MSKPVVQAVTQAEYDAIVVKVRKQIDLQVTYPYETILHKAMLGQVSVVADKIPYEQLKLMMDEVYDYGRIVTIPSEAVAVASRQGQQESVDLTGSSERPGVKSFVFSPVMPNLDTARDGYIYIPYVLRTE